MAALPLVLAGVSGVASIAGGLIGQQSSNTAAAANRLQAKAYRQEGKQALKLAKYEAQQGEYIADYAADRLREQATEEESLAAERARERLRDTRSVMSTQLARAAANGIGVVNPTVLDLFEDTSERGAYLADSERRAGARAGRDLRTRAAETILSADMESQLTRYKGYQAKLASRYGAQGQLLAAQGNKLAGVGSLIGGFGSAAGSFGSAYANYRA